MVLSDPPSAGGELNDSMGIQHVEETSAIHLVDVNIILTVVYLAIFVIGVVGNICNCIVIADSRNKYMKTATNYYLFSLSVSDLLLLIFGLPHDLVNLWHPSPYMFNQFVCISRGWISEASTYASVLVIVAFTVERYLAICHPLRAHTLSRLSRSVKIIILIWLVASSCALIVVMQYGVIIITERRADGRDTSNAQCTTVRRNETIFELSVFVFFIVPMAVITILYVKLGCHLRQKTHLIKQNQVKRQQGLFSTDSLQHSFVSDSQISATNYISTTANDAHPQGRPLDSQARPDLRWKDAPRSSASGPRLLALCPCTRASNNSKTNESRATKRGQPTRPGWEQNCSLAALDGANERGNFEAASTVTTIKLSVTGVVQDFNEKNYIMRSASDQRKLPNRAESFRSASDFQPKLAAPANEHIREHQNVSATKNDQLAPSSRRHNRQRPYLSSSSSVLDTMREEEVMVIESGPHSATTDTCATVAFDAPNQTNQPSNGDWPQQSVVAGETGGQSDRIHLSAKLNSKSSEAGMNGLKGPGASEAASRANSNDNLFRSGEGRTEPTDHCGKSIRLGANADSYSLSSRLPAVNIAPAGVGVDKGSTLSLQASKKHVDDHLVTSCGKQSTAAGMTSPKFQRNAAAKNISTEGCNNVRVDTYRASHKDHVMGASPTYLTDDKDTALISNSTPQKQQNHRHKREHHHQKPIALNSTVNKANMQSVIKMLVSVVVMFFICWAPFHAQRLMAVYVTEPTVEQEYIYNLLNHISGISYYISAVVNPILYSLFSVKFRQAFRDTFSSMKLCSPNGR